MTTDQTEIFRQDEGDNWFQRNRSALSGAADSDHVLAMALAWNERSPVHSICELGCANGWRLAALADQLKQQVRLAGSDLSRDAIEDGRQAWPDLELAVGSLAEPNVRGPFDLVIVSFVFHWVGRDRLAASVAGVDALVADGGALILADFLPDRPCARRYHHRDDVEIYTYKQDYSRCFTGLGTYEEVDRELFAHSGNATGTIDPQDRTACVLLRKTNDSYERA